MSQLVHVGIFEREAKLMDAIAESRESELEVIDAYSPYPIHGIDEAIGIRRSRLPVVCFLGGLAGLTLGLAFQYWSSATSWPLDVGGKPFDSLPAFVPVGFELTVLLGGLSTVLALLLRSRLWPGKRDASIERVTDDRFALAVARRDASLSAAEVQSLLARHGAIEIRSEVRS